MDICVIYFASLNQLILFPLTSNNSNRIGGVMVSVLASNAIYRGFEPRSGKTKDSKISICCFSAKHAALRKKSRLVGSDSE